MFESAKAATHLEVGKPLPQWGDGHTIWRWENDGFEFFSPDERLSEEQIRQWREAAQAHGDTFTVKIADGRIVYRVEGGELALKLKEMMADRETADGADQGDQERRGVPQA